MVLLCQPSIPKNDHNKDQAKESNRIFEKSGNISLSKNQCWQDNAAVLSLNCKQSLLFDEIRRASQESSAKGKSKLPRLTPSDR